MLEKVGLSAQNAVEVILSRASAFSIEMPTVRDSDYEQEAMFSRYALL